MGINLRAGTVTDDLRPALADRALADAALYLAGHATGGAAEERDGLVLFAGAHPYPGPYCNGMVRLDRDMEADEALTRAEAFFAPRRRGFIVWTRSGVDDDLASVSRGRGWFERPPPEGMPLIARDAEPAPEPAPGSGDPAPDPITTLEQARDYLAVVADAYGMGEAPVALQEAIFFTPRAVLADGALGVLLEHEGRPAAGAMTTIKGGVACLLWAATSPWAQGHGLGPACMRAITSAAFARGAGLVVAQSSQSGLPHWTRLGFDPLGSYHRFLAPLASQR